MTRSIKALIATLLMVAAGCDSDSAEVIDRSIDTVQLAASASRMELWETVQLTAVAKAVDGTVRTDVDVEWTVNDTTIATLTVTGHTAVLKGKRAGFAAVVAKVANKAAQVQVEVMQTAPANPVPLLDRLEPSAVTAGSVGTVVKVRGWNFTPQSVVRWDGIAKATTFVNANELTFVATPFDVLALGDADIRVFNPAPGGGMSQGSLTFTIYGPATTIEINAGGASLFWPGEHVNFAATAKDALGRILTGVPIEWSTNNNAVVQVNANGAATMVAKGNAVVSARAGTMINGFVVNVLTPPDADLVFDALEDGVRQLFVVSPGANLNRRKLLPSGTAATEAAVTRDGQKIAFTGVGANGSTDIFTVNPDGSGLRQLTFSGYADEQPTWSPDGQRIAFRSRRNFGYSDVWVMNADGSNQVNLTDTGVRLGMYGYEEPTWSPDGQHMIYTLVDEGMTPRRSTLMKMRIATRTPEVLVHDNTIDLYEPAYSPDGQVLAVRYKSAAFGNQLYFLNPANGEFWIFIDYPGPGSKPAVAPDNKWIAFESSPVYGTTGGVYVNLLGTMMRKGVGVGSAAGNPANPVWMAR